MNCSSESFLGYVDWNERPDKSWSSARKNKLAKDSGEEEKRDLVAERRESEDSEKEEIGRLKETMQEVILRLSGLEYRLDVHMNTLDELAHKI